MPSELEATGGDEPSAVLEASVARLRALVEKLPVGRLRYPSYASEWTIADVLSHIGSGAVILRRRLEDALADRPADDDFAPATWDEWNAKSPEDQATDVLAVDQALVDRIAEITPAEAATFQLSMGPTTLDLPGFVGLRVNEHGLHTWDVAVALDPDERLPADVTGVVVDNLGMVVGFTGKPTGEAHTLSVRTNGPTRHLALRFGIDDVELVPVDPAGAEGPPDLEIAAEAFVRLVYGRLDPDHTPAGTDPTHLDELRQAFPGI